jgi:thioredoxin-dependent peroxiredoxin
LAEESREFVRKKSLRLPLLSDPERKVISAYGVADADNGIAVPSVFVVSREGKIVWRHVGETQMDRPAVDVLLEQLDQAP